MPIRGLESSAITFVHVNDVAESIVRALEKEDNIGEGYIIGKEYLSIRQLNQWITQLSGLTIVGLEMRITL